MTVSLDLGELVSHVTVDTRDGRRALGDFTRDLVGFADAAQWAGENAGQEFGDGFKEKGKAAAAAGGAAVGAALMLGLNEAFDREEASGKLAAQLGLDPKQQQRLGRIAGNLYANAFGDSLGEVNAAIAAVRSSLDGVGTDKAIRRATADALNFAATFDVDVARSVQVVGQLMNTGLVKDARKGFDLITAGSQRVPAAVRDDLLDAADEYGQFFAALGMNGRETFDLLVKAAEDGMYGIDKTGDAIKEFTILSTDMSTASKDAYKSIGLNARTMADDVLAGGERAREALQRVVTGLLNVESPSRRAEAALALFGTPLEDLSVKEIPDFLKSLKLARGGLDDVQGSARDMGKALADNTRSDFAKMKRGLEKEVITFLAEDALPFIKDDVVPAFQAIGDALDTVPDWAIKGSVGGVLGLIAAGKLGSLASDLRGLRGVAGGSIGGAVSRSAPVPVFVTNPGFGGPGTPAGSRTRNGMRNIARALPWLAVADAAYETTAGDLYGLDKDGPSESPIVRAGGGAFGLGAFNREDMEQVEEAVKDVGAELDVVNSKATGLQELLDLVGNTKITPLVGTSSIDAAMAKLAALNAALNAGMHAVSTAGVDGGAPFLSGGGSSVSERGGVTFTGPINVKANDPNRMLSEIDRRRRRAQSDGVRRW